MTAKTFRIRRISWIEKGICFGSLTLLAMLPLTDVALRQFHIALPALKTLMVHLFLVVGFFAAMLTARSGKHIAITATQYVRNVKVKRLLQFVGALVSIFVLTILAWDSVCFIKYDEFLGRLVGPLPARVFAIAMPLGYMVIAIRFLIKLRPAWKRVVALAAIVLGTAAAFPAIAKIIWGIDGVNTPEPFYSIVDSMYIAVEIVRVPAILFLILSAFFGTPIFAAIGGIALIMFQAGGQEPDRAPIQIFDALTNIDLIAIPLFTLTGFFLSESKAGERLVRTFRAFLGWLPGGMVIAAVIICAFFTSFTGASGVTILALGGILYTILVDNKYRERFSTGLLTSVGGIGLMFPPSLPIILVGTTSIMILHFMNVPSGYEIKHFFIGALIPGIILVLAMIIAGIAISVKTKVPVEKFDKKESLSSLKGSFLEILLPIVLVTGYFSGQLGLLEASAFSVLYVIVVEVYINKDIAIRNIPRVFSKAVPIIGGVLAILAVAKALSSAFVDSGVPNDFAFWMQNAIHSKYVFLALLNLALLITGCVMDIFSAILVLLPLVVPLGHAYGIDPVHLGIIFIVNLEIGFLTPPVGLNLFLASYRFEKPFAQICRSVVPFLLVQIFVLLLVTYIPPLSTWLPSFFK